jgi:hypothetical protein
MGKKAGGNYRVIKAIVQTKVGAAPNPIRMREVSTQANSWEIAERNEANVQRQIPAINSRRAPNRTTSRPAGTCKNM